MFCLTYYECIKHLNLSTIRMGSLANAMNHALSALNSRLNIIIDSYAVRYTHQGLSCFILPYYYKPFQCFNIVCTQIPDKPLAY